MHVLQWIAVEAEDKQDALTTVEAQLENMLNPDYQNGWFDWFVAGGGRWNVSEDEDWKEAYTEGKTNMIISAKTDKDKFVERVNLSLEARKTEFDRFASEAKLDLLEKVIANYNPKQPDYTYFTDLYSIKKVIDMAFGEWDFNSYYFDLTNETTNPQYALEGIEKDKSVWYLVPVDFHF